MAEQHCKELMAVRAQNLKSIISMNAKRKGDKLQACATDCKQE